MRVQREQPVGLHQCVRTDEEIGEQAFRAGFGRLTPAGSVKRKASGCFSPDPFLDPKIDKNTGSQEKTLDKGFGCSGIGVQFSKNER